MSVRSAIWLAGAAVKPAVVLRKTLYVTPRVVLAVHARSIWLLDTGFAERPEGADGVVSVVESVAIDRGATVMVLAVGEMHRERARGDVVRHVGDSLVDGLRYTEKRGVFAVMV